MIYNPFDIMFGPWFDMYVRLMIDLYYFPYTIVPDDDGVCNS
jgi:hypothetical protein